MSIHSILAALQNIPPLRRTRIASRRFGFRPQLDSLDGRITPSFTPAVNYSVGDGPIDVATGDFNNDNRIDLVTANHWDSTVSVRLGDGQGGFGLATNLTVGLNPRSVAVGDFNGDAIDDLATANSGSGDVSVLLSNGNGTFQTAVSTNLNLGPYGTLLSIAEGDFNSDGKMDLVVGASHYDSYYYGNLGEVSVLLSDGYGGFTNPYGWNFTYYEPYDLAVGHLNGDGNLDIATAGNWGFVVTMLGNGSGGLGNLQYPNSVYASAVEIGEFTGDGNLDLAVAGSTVSVLPGTGNGTFGTPISGLDNTIWPANLAASEFNGDGNLDLVATDPNTNAVLAYLGAGNGLFNEPILHAVGNYPYEVVVGMFNSDGLPDVVAGNLDSNSVSVLLNDGIWPAVTPRIAIGDVSVAEGNTGTVEAKFVVTLSTASLDPISIQFTTANNTASAGTDYQSAASTLTFAPGEVSKTVTILVNGDRLGEAATESFFVNLSNATNASIYDSQGVGTIVDNEPRISINDVSQNEGNGKSSTFSFTVTLSAAYDQNVTVNFSTQDGTAQSGSDYQSKSGTVTFLPGETTKTITITVYGDKKREGNETFFVNLSSPSTNAWLFDPQGKGTILDDDRRS